MDIGLLVPVSAPYARRDFVQMLGTLAETRGFHSLWVGEHVVVPKESASLYPVSEDGKMPSAIQKGELDPYTTLAYLAAITHTIRLGACTIIPQRNPIYTAKEIANVDWLSEGRVDVGAGLGWSKEEFDAVAAPFPSRGARCDSYLRILKECWMNPVAEFKDEFYELPPSLLYPKPLQDPHPPIHILGSSPKAIQRTAELGDGILPLDEGPDEIGDLLKNLDSELQKLGRRLDDIRISACPYTRHCDLDLVKRYRDVGVEQLVLFQFIEDTGELERTIEAFAETIVEPARSL